MAIIKPKITAGSGTASGNVVYNCSTCSITASENTGVTKYYFEVTFSAGNYKNIGNYTSRATGVLGIAVDLSTSEAKIFNTAGQIGTASYGSVNCSIYINENGSNTFNYGNTPFTCAVPAGYTPYCETYKLLIKDGDAIKKYADGAWTAVGVYSRDLTEALFKTDGMSSLSNVPVTAYESLSSNPSILVLGQDKTTITRITAVSFPKLVLASDDIGIVSVECINSMTATKTLSGGGDVKIIVSIDRGITWKAFHDNVWIDINTSDLSDVAAHGISFTSLDSISKNAWSELIKLSKTIRFGYLLSNTSSTDVASTDKIEMSVDMKGAWRLKVVETAWDMDFIDKTTIRVSLYASGDYKINY